VQLLSPELKKQINGTDFVMDQYRKTLDECDILPGTPAQEVRMKQMVNLNHRWFMQTLLDRKDRMSMYSGLEVRVPFCDYRIAEYLYSVPWEMKDYQGREKGLLRSAMEGFLPEQVLYRKKSPYPKTYDPKYTQLVYNRLKELINQPDAPIFAMVDRFALNQILDSEYTWPWYGQLMKGPQTAAFMLQLDFWLRHYRVNVL
jgi:asparagine synthase (glutamine-hydrolysing)